jgi:hypothetical protein
MSNAELRKEWEVRIAAFRAIGQSASAWCRAHQTPASISLRVQRKPARRWLCGLPWDTGCDPGRLLGSRPAQIR